MPLPNSIVIALEQLGEASAREIADHTDRPIESVKSQISQMIARDEPAIRNTGRFTAGAIREPIFDLSGDAPKDEAPAATNGHAPAQPTSDREKVGAYPGQEPYAKDRKERAAGVETGHMEPAPADEMATLRARLRGLEAANERLEQGLEAEQAAHAQTKEAYDGLAQRAVEAEESLEERQGWANLTQGELDEIAEVLGIEKDAPHGAVRDAIQELKVAASASVTASALQGALEALGDQPPEGGSAAVARAERAEQELAGMAVTLDELRNEVARGQIALARARLDDAETQAMRQRYFDLLVGMAERDRDEVIFDRLERLLDGPLNHDHAEA